MYFRPDIFHVTGVRNGVCRQDGRRGEKEFHPREYEVNMIVRELIHDMHVDTHDLTNAKSSGCDFSNLTVLQAARVILPLSI